MLGRADDPDKVFRRVDGTSEVSLIYVGSNPKILEKVLQAAAQPNTAMKIVAAVAFVNPVYRRDDSVAVVVDSAFVLNCGPMSQVQSKNLDTLVQAIKTAQVSTKWYVSRALAENAKQALDTREKLVAVRELERLDKPGTPISYLGNARKDYEAQKITLEVRQAEAEQSKAKQQFFENLKGSPCRVAHSRLTAAK